MAILPSQKSSLKLLKQFKTEYESRTGINNFAKGSFARTAIDILSEEILQQREDMNNVFFADQISNAVDEDLDRIGEKLGLRRRDERFASVDSVDACLVFYVESGTFGDINGASNIAVASGKTVSTDDGKIVYILTGATLIAGDAVAYVSARAKATGAGHNVDQQVLNTHNVTEYTDSASSSLKVTNLYSILNGRDRESPTSYRFRLSQWYLRGLQINQSKILLSSLEIPGVVNITTIPGYFGIGTAGVIVRGAENETNQRLLNAVQAQLDALKGPGDRYIATAATKVYFDFDLKIQTTDLDTTAIKNQISTIMNNYFRRLSLGDTVNLTNLLKEINTSVSKMFSIDLENSLFSKVYIRKGYSSFTTDERQTLLVDIYTLRLDEFAALGSLELI